MIGGNTAAAPTAAAPAPALAPQPRTSPKDGDDHSTAIDLGSSAGLGEAIFRPLLKGNMRCAWMSECKAGDHVRVRLTDPRDDTRKWIRCAIAESKCKDNIEPAPLLAVRTREDMEKWLPTGPKKKFRLLPASRILDVDPTTVLVVTEKEFKDGAYNDAELRSTIDDLTPRTSVAVRVPYHCVVRTQKHTGEWVHVPMDNGDHTNCISLWSHGEVTQSTMIHGDHGVHQIEVSSDFVPWDDVAKVSDLQRDSHEFCVGDGLSEVLCFNVTSDDKEEGIKAVLEVAHGISKKGSPRMRVRTSGGRWRHGTGWCLLEVGQGTVNKVVGKLRANAPWLNAIAKTECTIGYTPFIIDRTSWPHPDADHPGVEDNVCARPVAVAGSLFVYVSTALTSPWTIQPSRLVDLLEQDPLCLNGSTVFVHDENDGSTSEPATVLSYLPHLRQLLIRAHCGGHHDPPAYFMRHRRYYKQSEQGKYSLKLIDPFVVSSRLRIEPLAVPHTEARAIASFRQHFATCKVCLEIKRKPDFSDFCFETFRVSGDGLHIASPRHPGSVCRECLSTHCDVALRSGQLYVSCPAEDCGRNLQTMELQKFVPPSAFEKLLSGLRDVEVNGARAFKTQGDLAGLDLRGCPKCAAAIEKNQGCSSMRCYRCGHNFKWDNAIVIEPTAPPVTERLFKTVGNVGDAAGNGLSTGARTTFDTLELSFESMWTCVRFLISWLPIWAAMCLCLYIAYASPKGQKIRQTVGLTPVVEALLSRLPDYVVNGECSLLPMPGAFDSWCIAPTASLQARWNAVVVTVGWVLLTPLYVATVCIGALALSPLADDPTTRTSISNRFKGFVVLFCSMTLLPALAAGSDVIWRLLPGPLADAVWFLLGNAVNVFKFVCFDHFLMASGSIVLVLFFVEFSRLHRCIRKAILRAEISPENDIISLRWLSRYVLGPAFFAAAGLTAGLASIFAAHPRALRRAFNTRFVRLWDGSIEPFILKYDPPRDVHSNLSVTTLLGVGSNPPARRSGERAFQTSTASLDQESLGRPLRVVHFVHHVVSMAVNPPTRYGTVDVIPALVFTAVMLW
eukprot:CAMPEP_0182922440 /NCGR_PEP_ID=MMETSP0105_2-20130417/4796_1 /TAXON_ID=81532 ORGANISM="Acanthoeca-like sp., Strain 10tr" /NCGR_SAMPLE_ID=MMETSP0105_2 /ASSEMBLY_ACC=CAM_ASM_000205 /LENGTH=1067 /DNA_ID=CAMNT_0025060055 /DNA_START=175 /DNA_END=3375 /DNA_ORIENTATION=+